MAASEIIHTLESNTRKMEQTDYLLRQINQLTNLLKAFLSTALKLKEANPSCCLNTIDSTLKELLGKHINDLENLSEEAFLDVKPLT